MKQRLEWHTIEADTVGQLVEALKAFPPEAELYFGYQDDLFQVGVYRDETPAEREARLLEDKRYRERRKDLKAEWDGVIDWFDRKEWKEAKG